MSSKYLVDPYGVLGGTLNSALPSDRLVARWDLLRDEARNPPQPLETTPHNYALHADTLTSNLTDEPLLFVETPKDINALSTDPDRALAWRLAQREVFLELFGRGYTVTRFIDGCYVLER